MKTACRITYWVSIGILILSIIGLALSVVYLYQAVINHYYTNTCTVNSCVQSTPSCCSGSGASYYCKMHLFITLSATLTVNNASYTNTFGWDCNNYNGNNWGSWYMCGDPNLKTVPCYWDDRSPPSQFKLSTYYYPPPGNGIAAIVIIVILIVISIIIIICSAYVNKSVY